MKSVSAFRLWLPTFSGSSRARYLKWVIALPNLPRLIKTSNNIFGITREREHFHKNIFFFFFIIEKDDWLK